MALDPESPDVRVAVFGRQVEDFMGSDIGQYLSQCIDSEIADGLLSLRKAPPAEWKQVAIAQLRIDCAEKLRNWLAEAIQRGYEARELLEDQ